MATPLTATTDCTEFYQAVRDAMNAMWPNLTRLAKKQSDGRADTGDTIHAFALTAASRIGGLATGTGWGRSAADVLDAAEAASIDHKKSVDAFMRIYEAANEHVQTTTTQEDNE